MIYLQVEDDIVEVDSWDVISARESFSSNLSLKERKLEKIIGYYELPDKLRCGLDSCHTPHNKGYIVQTDIGDETNIGNACGRKYFDVIFTSMSKDFMNTLEYAKLKSYLLEMKPNLFSLWQKVNALDVGSKNASWAIKMQEKMSDSEAIGLTAYRALRDMFASNSGNVISSRPPTQREIDIATSTGNPAPQSIDIVVGFISNIEFLSPDDKIDDLFHKRLKGPIDALQKSDIEKLSRTQMQPIAKGIRSLDTNTDLLRGKLEIAREFLTKENLSQLLIGMRGNPNTSLSDIQKYEEFLEQL